TDYFTRKANAELNKNVQGPDAAVRALFRRYDWPGNLRELKNMIKRAVLLSKGSHFTVEALPEEMVSAIEQPAANTGPDLKALQAANEKELITQTLQAVKYNKS